MNEAIPAAGADRRTERRVRVKLPLEVHGVDRSGAKFAERTTSEDLCRGGVAFLLEHEIEVDVELELSIPLPDRKSTRLNSSHLKLSRMPSSA